MQDYLQLKAQGINISEFVRNTLKYAVDKEINEDEEELKELIEKNKQIQIDAQKNLAEYAMKLSVLQEKRRQDRSNDMREKIALKQTLQEAGVLNWDM